MTARAMSPGAAALRDHAKICQRCAAAALAGKPITQLCGAGFILATAAIKARARRTS